MAAIAELAQADQFEPIVEEGVDDVLDGHLGGVGSRRPAGMEIVLAIEVA